MYFINRQIVIKRQSAILKNSNFGSLLEMWANHTSKN